jgi:hypothetical protein
VTTTPKRDVIAAQLQSPAPCAVKRAGIVDEIRLAPSIIRQSISTAGELAAALPHSAILAPKVRLIW